MTHTPGLLDTIRKRFSEATRSYDSHARVQDEASSQLAERILFKARRSGYRNVFEAGAGTGLLTRRLAEAGLFQHITVTDLSETMLRVNRMLLRDLEGFILQQLDLNAYEPVLNYDVFAANMCFQWVQDPESVVQAASKSLVDGGMLAFTVPVAGSFQEWHEAATQAGVPCTANPLYAGEDWARFTAEADLLPEFAEFETRMSFPDISGFFHSLKFIGAGTALAHTPLSAAAMRKLVRAAPAPFDITYRIAVITAIR